VDGPRSYQDESDGRWYGAFAERHSEPESRYEEERYRTPDPRYSDEPSGDLGRYRDRPDPLTDPALGTRPVGPRSGVELPPPMSEPGERYGEPRFGTEPIDRSGLRRPPAGTPGGPAAPPGAPGALPAMPTMATEAVGGAIYRTRRVGVAAVLAAVAIVAELLLVRVLTTGEFGHTVLPGAVLAGIFGMCGIPLVTMGLYGLMTGAATAGGPTPGRAWLRTPLAYLPVGLVLLIAAGLAA
jgi:hypothetical protein